MVWRNWGNDDFWFFHLPANDERLLKLFFFSFLLLLASPYHHHHHHNGKNATKCTIKYRTEKLSINEMQSAHHCLCFPYILYSVFNQWNDFTIKLGDTNAQELFNEFDKVKNIELACSLARVHHTYIHTQREKWEITLRAPIIRNVRARTRLELQIAAFILVEQIEWVHIAHTHI